MALAVRLGSVVARRYRTTRRVSGGAMGEVWEAVHTDLGRRVALKVLRKESQACREIVLRFAREAHLLARIESDHVVRVIDYLPKTRHGPILVMDLLEGPTLADVIHQDRLSIEAAVDVAIDICRGLEAMHACGVIHRDVKPGNVVLQPTPKGGRRAVLVDLGVGRCVDEVPKPGDEEITVADRVVGTFEYMAPEQILSSHTATSAVDVYAVGAVLFRAVAGAHPYGDKHGVELLRAKLQEPIPRLRTGRFDAAALRFESLVERALAFGAAERFASATELAAALEELRVELRGEKPPSPSSRPPSPLGRRAVAIAAMSAAAFAACTVDEVPAKGDVQHAQQAEVLVCR